MSRTTDQWQALLDGTSSGDWEAGEGGVEVFAVTDHSRAFVADAGSHLLSCQGEALTEARKDAVLIAAAPEAVAEVVRLRRELEELRDDLGKACHFSDPDPDDYSLGEMKEATRIGRVLTDILNQEETR